LDRLRPPALIDLTRSEALEVLEELGEQVSKAWTRMELKKKMHEVLEKDEPMIEFIGNLHRQSRGELIETCRKREIAMSKNDTDQALRKRIKEHAREVCEPGPRDFVDFGVHRDLRYHEVETQWPEFAKCVINTATSGEGDKELMRLARWLQRDAKPGPQMVGSSSSGPTWRAPNEKETESGGAVRQYDAVLQMLGQIMVRLERLETAHGIEQTHPLEQARPSAS
jgi:hypothetical protein